jgi:hypothetical protein
MSRERRQFLQQLTLGSVALGVAPGLLGASTPDASLESIGSANEGMHAFLEAMQPQQPAFDTTWAQKLTGKYKAVFDVPELSEGSGVFRAALWRNHYRDLMQATPADLSPVLVIRHNAMPFIMTHEFWDRYDVAKAEKLKHPMTGKNTRRNIVNMTAEDDGLPAGFASYSLDKQIAAGTVVLGCNMAFSAMIALVRQKDKLAGGAAREKALSMMLPGVMLQPNGIFAVTMAQQAGCAYVYAS